MKRFYFCERQCAPSPRWAAKGQCAPSLKHVATRLPPAGPHTDIQCRNRRRHNSRSNRQRRQPRRHCQRPQLEKGKSPQESRVTVQIEQYLLCSAVQLTSCSSPTATASWLTSSTLPHVSLGASQLLKPAYVDTTAKLRPQASVLALRASGASQLL